MYGAKNVKPQVLAAFTKPDFLVLWLAPFGAYLFLLLFYTFGFLKLPSSCILSSSAMLGAAVILELFQDKVRIFRRVAILLVVATLVGSFLGLYIYDVLAIFPQFYANSRLYTNVVSSELGAAVSDAGTIMFAEDSFVDVNHAVSYVIESGHRYCVAPVRDSNPSLTVEFWAVGAECCGQTGSFTCDSAMDKQARSGIVLFDNNGMFGSTSHDVYVKALRKAEATFGLTSSESPLFVRWVRQDALNTVSWEYTWKVWLALTLAALSYLGISAGMARSLYTQQPVFHPP